MSVGKDNQEPSMEEILSSIRRIIADEQDEPPAEAKAPMSIRKDPEPIAAAPADDDDELELTEAIEPSPAPIVPPQPAVARPEPAPAPIIRKEEPATMSTPPDEGIVSSMAASASTSALARLTRSIQPDDRSGPTVPGVTVEQLVIDLLRPQLKEWLDQHLAAIVERVVEQEVNKLARRAELL